MRRAFLNSALALPLLALASAPAFAQDRADSAYEPNDTNEQADRYDDGYSYDDANEDDRDMRDFQTGAVEKLKDPRFQAQMGDMMGAMMQAMMSMKIGGIAEAAGKMDPNSRMARVDPDATVGDMVSDGDPHYAERMADKTRVMAKTAGTMAGSMAEMMPVLARMAQDMGAQMEKSMGREMRKIERDIDKN